MPLKIIGAGFGRTGTTSVAEALRQLGYPCYHMKDVLFDPRHKGDVDFWLGVDETTPQDAWERVFAGYTATVDFPGCAAWRALARAFPQARVLLTLHPKGAEGWYDSTVRTIYQGTGLGASTEFGGKVNAMLDRLVWNGMLQGAMASRETALARYEAHIAEVRAEIAPERLLVFSADQGWAPFCAFLGHPVPDRPFPNVNSGDEMGRRLRRLNMMRPKAPAGAA